MGSRSQREQRNTIAILASFFVIFCGYFSSLMLVIGSAEEPVIAGA